MIIDELIKIQKQRGLDNKEFAKSLGIYLESWYRNKRTRIIDAETLLRAFEVYPELREAWLSSFDNRVTDRPEKPCNQREGLLKRFLGVIYRLSK